MYILIVGAGEVGSYVGDALVREGHEVAIVEADEELARRLDSTMNALVVHGSGVDPAVLRRAGLGDADLFLAVTAIDEVNLIACMTAEKHGRKDIRTVARVRWTWQAADSPNLSAGDLGLDAVISPREEIAAETMDVLRYAGSGELRELAGGKLALVGMSLAVDSPLVHDTLARIRNDYSSDFLVVAVRGPNGVRIPGGEDRLEVGERAFVLTLPENVTELAILSGQPWFYVQRVLVVGCGNSGLSVAQELEKQNLTTTVIEKDPKRAELVAGVLKRSLVICGDASHPEFLQQQIDESQSDAVVVLLQDSERSLLIGIFAKSLGARKVVVRCDESGYVPLAHKLGIDAVLSPKRAIINAILRYVRRGKVESTLLLGEHEGELIQFKVPEHPAHPEVLEKSLMELGFPRGSLVGAVVRNNAAFIASGKTILKPGDELFVACGFEMLKHVDELLS